MSTQQGFILQQSRENNYSSRMKEQQQRNGVHYHTKYMEIYLRTLE